MRHLLAALVLLLWMGGYARCVAETSGALPAAQMLCCGQEHSGDATGDGQDCGVCDAILKGGLFFGKISVLAGVLFAAAVVCGWLLRSVLPLLFRRPAIARIGFHHTRRKPSGLRKWCEVLVATACPVRGPDLLSV